MRSSMTVLCSILCLVGCQQTESICATSTDVRAYRFSATITNNDGLSPFEIGKEMTGQFTYSLKGEDRLPEDSPREHMGRFSAKQNELSIRVGDMNFKASGEIQVLIAKFDNGERFEIVAGDFSVPEGWLIDHSDITHGCEFSLLNYPAQEALTNSNIPEKLNLDKWEERRVRLCFPEVVVFPGGKVKRDPSLGIRFVTATVKKLEEVK